MTHSEYMKKALELAKKGMGFVSPNPMVGAVIVKDGEIIGQGFHRKYGELHAERNAFADCRARGNSAEGADLYVTLEPCCHYGKTPPCTEAVIENKIKRVFIGSSDPNPLVAGKGAEILKNNGIEVYEGVLKDECDELNEVFFHYIKLKKPFVIMKYAMTIDGKIACFNGSSRWVTGESARLNVQKDRKRYSAIMVGVNTVISDNPMLTCRIENGVNPTRIICDTNLRTPIDCNITDTAKEVPAIIATCCNDTEKQAEYIKKGCKIIVTEKKDNHVNLNQLVDELGKLKIDSVILEGGGELNWSAIKSGIVDKVQAYIAPKIFGGANAKTAVSGTGFDSPDKACILYDSHIRQIGDDFLIESRVKKCSQE